MYPLEARKQNLIRNLEKYGFAKRHIKWVKSQPPSVYLMKDFHERIDRSICTKIWMYRNYLYRKWNGLPDRRLS